LGIVSKYLEKQKSLEIKAFSCCLDAPCRLFERNLEKSKMKLFQNGVKAKFPSLLSQLFLILVPKSFNS
jgi:hypothetical protein